MDFSEKLNSIAVNCGADMVIGTHIEIFSNKKILIEGCYGINEYNEELVRINLSKGQLLIFGRNLELKNMESKNITVIGIIHSIEFPGG